MRLLSLLGMATLCNACLSSGVVDGAPKDSTFESPVVAWDLIADLRLALQDPSGHQPQVYPNPLLCDQLTVAMTHEGNLRGKCFRDGLDTEVVYGGPIDGIPYFVSFAINADRLHATIRDIYGLAVYSINDLPDTCGTIVIDSANTCSVCTDESGAVDVNNCPDPVDPPPPVDPPDDNPPALETESCADAGIDAFFASLYTLVANEGLPAPAVGPADVGQPSESGALMVVGPGGTCGGDATGGPAVLGDILRSDGRVSCGLLGTYAYANACQDIPDGCAASPELDAFAQGVNDAYVAWATYTVDHLGGSATWGAEGLEDPYEPPEDEFPECVASPLVFDLADQGVRLTAVEQGVQFDLLGVGRSVQTGWIQNGQFLTFDRNFDGRITSGRELFGEGTILATGARATDGFQALAQYDRLEQGGNEDGRIDDHDAIFPLLSLWADQNQNGQTEPAELAPLDAAGVDAIHLDGKPAWIPTDSPLGNSLGIEGTFTRTGGGVGRVLDVYFDFRPIVEIPSA